MLNTLLNVVWWIELYNFFLNFMIVDGLVVLRFAFVLTGFLFLGPQQLICTTQVFLCLVFN
jgi:hypothetical protein